MKQAITLFLLSLLFTFSSCRRTYEMGTDVRHIPVIVKDYEIVGTVRIESKIGKSEATYDGLLQKARGQYGEKVDIANVKIDKLAKSSNWIILNAYVIKYKEN
jgi:hypothetical protein